MERKDKILEIAQKVFSERSAVVIERVSAEYMACGDQIRKALQNAVAPLIDLGKKQQREGLKGPVHYVVISYLHSSSITRSNLFQLALMDEHDYLDPVDTSAFWCPDFIFRFLEEDMICLQKAVGRELIRVKPYELDAARRGYICQFYDALAGVFFAQTAPDAFAAAGLHELATTDEVQFLYGGLMDKAVLFAALRKETAP